MKRIVRDETIKWVLRKEDGRTIIKLLFLTERWTKIDDLKPLLLNAIFFLRIFNSKRIVAGAREADP